MTTEFTGYETNSTLATPEGGAFAATPVWERRRKARRFGGLPKTAKVATTAPADAAPLAARRPVSAKTRNTNGSALVTVGLAVGLVAIVGAVGWQAMRGGDMTASPAPSAPASTLSEVDGAPAEPAQPMELAANEPAAPPAAAPPVQSAPARTDRVAAPKPAPPVRPATPASADELGVNTATTLPDGPQPYTTLEPSTSTAPPTVALTPPTTTEAAQPVIPSAPPFLPSPATTDPSPESAAPPT